MPEELYPNNSLKAQEANGTVVDDIKPIVSKPAVVKKKGFFERVGDSLIEGELKNVGNYIVKDVIVPGLKTAISTGITSAINMLLYGNPGQPQQQRPNQYYQTSYQNPYWASSRYSQYNQAPVYQQSNPYQDETYYFDSVNDAQAVIAALRNQIAIDTRNHRVTLYYLNAITGRQKDYTMQNYGWYDLATASVIQLNNGQAMIKLPKPILFD